MLRLLLAIGLALAPLAISVEPPRIDGFHRIWVEPAPTLDGLQPSTPLASSASPPDTLPGIAILSLDPRALAEAGLTPQTLADRVRELQGVTAARLSEDQDALWVQSIPPDSPETLRIPPLDGDPVPLEALGSLQLMPRLGPQMPVPASPDGEDPSTVHDLIVRNTLGIRAVVRIEDVEIGELDPHRTGTLRDIKPGTYTITLTTPDGASTGLQAPSKPR